MKYLGKEILGLDYQYEAPQEILWQGIYHPEAENAFESLEDYIGDKELGAKSSGEVIEEFFTGRIKIDALVNLQSVFNVNGTEDSVNVLKKLDSPVFHPLMVASSIYLQF